MAISTLPCRRCKHAEYMHDTGTGACCDLFTLANGSKIACVCDRYVRGAA